MNHSKGNAYIMVTIAAMAIFMLIGILLVVTITSRQVTTRQTYYLGLYNLGVNGNEQALFFMETALDNHRYEILAQITPTDDCETNLALFASAATPFILEDINQHMTWSITASFDNGIASTYTATTIVNTSPRGFMVETRVNTYIDGVPTHPAGVLAQIIWYGSNKCDKILGNCLDYYTLKMVELLRTIN